MHCFGIYECLLDKDIAVAAMQADMLQAVYTKLPTIVHASIFLQRAIKFQLNGCAYNDFLVRMFSMSFQRFTTTSRPHVRKFGRHICLI